MSLHVTRSYLRELHTAVELLFMMAEEHTMEELSRRSKLGVGTLYNLRSHRTRLPQWRTMTYLADAVGCHISVEKNVIRMSIAKRSRRETG
jgi:hypothetical protein